MDSIWIKNAIETIMERMMEEGYTEKEVEYVEKIIESFVNGSANEALEYWFDSDTLDNLRNDIEMSSDFRHKIELAKEDKEDEEI